MYNDNNNNDMLNKNGINRGTNYIQKASYNN
jgi:hypothetical protein